LLDNSNEVRRAEEAQKVEEALRREEDRRIELDEKRAIVNEYRGRQAGQGGYNAPSFG
jgi:hypothetical protein